MYGGGEYPVDVYAQHSYYGAPAPSPAFNDGASDAVVQLAAARAEIAALKAEVAALKAAAAASSNGQTSSSPALVPPPQFYPPPGGSPYGAAPYYGGPPPGYGGAPGYPGGYGGSYGAPPPGGGARPPPTLALNADNKRGPKGANLAVFCIPNAYYDQQVLDLCAPHGNVVFCQVAAHRDTGLSRGYAFVSYETVEEAERAIAALHNLTVEGRALRVEVARADREAGSKPY